MIFFQIKQDAPITVKINSCHVLGGKGNSTSSQSSISTAIYHQKKKSSASRVIYLVLQFINLIYDETELLDFTALALPAGKNLTATCGIYSEREQHRTESFPYTKDPSQQVTENSKTKFSPSDVTEGGGLAAPLLLCGLPGAARRPGGAFGEAEGAQSEDAALGGGGSRSSRAREGRAALRSPELTRGRRRSRGERGR